MNFQVSNEVKSIVWFRDENSSFSCSSSAAVNAPECLQCNAPCSECSSNGLSTNAINLNQWMIAFRIHKRKRDTKIAALPKLTRPSQYCRHFLGNEWLSLVLFFFNLNFLYSISFGSDWIESILFGCVSVSFIVVPKT